MGRKEPIWSLKMSENPKFFLGVIYTYIHTYIIGKKNTISPKTTNNNNNPIVKTIHYMRNYLGILLLAICLFVSETKESSSCWLLLCS
jgi:hypothetical protein